MNARLRHSLQGYRGGSADLEMEILQTDVMRFMAILGFILVAIFSLVNALPVAQQDMRPMLERRDLLTRDIEQLQAHIAEQLEVLQQLRSEIRQTAELRQRLMQDTRSLAAQRETVQREARRLSQALQQRRAALGGLERNLDQHRQSLSRTRSELERERSRLAQLEREMVQLERQAQRLQAAPAPRPETEPEAESRPEPVPAPVQEQKPEPEPEPEQKPEPRQGFSLTFASAEAFTRLLRRGSIDFHAMAGSGSWQARWRQGRVEYQAGSQPQRFYEMAPATVPEVYRQALRRAVAAPRRGSVTWGVVLPPAMVERLQAQIAGKRGGDIVITAAGGIELENVNP